MSPHSLLGALDQRLTTTARVLLPAFTPDDQPRGAGQTANMLLPELVGACQEHGRPAESWLLLAALSARLPRAAEVARLVHEMTQHDTQWLVTAMLDTVLHDGQHANLALEMDLVVDGVVVNTDWCARYEPNTGIQRVVRRTLPRWERAGHSFVTTAWTDDGTAARTISDLERRRVFEHTDTPARPRDSDMPRAPRLVVPWRSVVVLPEVPQGDICQSLAALGELSGNHISAIGYDLIPLVEADLRPPAECENFLSYLTVIKHSHQVGAISESAMVEFAGFVDALVSQGLRGPRVREVPLPAEPPAATARESRPVLPPAREGMPLVLMVGSLEHHKNHLAVLYAAERLWRDGVDLDLSFIGGPGFNSAMIEDRIDALRAAGRPVRHLGRVADVELATAYVEADLTVFISLHEGFGLPVAESLACGTPVLTSDFGSMAELARDGGAITVDPRDDDAILEALRLLVTNPSRLAQLAEAARRRPTRTWDDYTSELWETLTTIETAAVR